MYKFANNYIEPITLTASDVTASLKLPDGKYRLSIADAAQNATRWEILDADVVSGSAALTRALEGTAAQEWPAGSVIYNTITAGIMEMLMAGGGEPEEPGTEEPLILHAQGDINLKAPIGSILYSADEKETWQENAAANFTVSLPTEVESTVYIKSNDDVELTEALTVRSTTTNTNNFKGVHQWWDSSRPIRLYVSDNSFYVPKVAPSNVTTMSGMFSGADAFNGDISQWDVSNVTSMSGMFAFCTAFNGDISNWDTSSVTNMNWMFQSTGAFNGDLSQWDVSNVTSMNSMFQRANAFNGDLSQWDVSNVTSMDSMFQRANAFNGDISSWCVSKIITKPDSFDSDANAWTLPKPIWGTCPP